MSAPATKPKLTPEQYLTLEEQAEFRSEYVQGEVYAMAGASDGHVTITGNFICAVQNLICGGFQAVKSYSSDMKVRVNEDEAYYYPDLLVTCTSDDHKRNYFKHDPLPDYRGFIRQY